MQQKKKSLAPTQNEQNTFYATLYTSRTGKPKTAIIGYGTKCPLEVSPADVEELYRVVKQLHKRTKLLQQLA
jgi:hypothetical protein